MCALCVQLLCVQWLSCVQLFVTPWIVTHQAPLSVGLFQARILEWKKKKRILEWVAISSSKRSSQLRIEPVFTVSPAFAGRFFTTEPPGHQAIL